MVLQGREEGSKTDAVMLDPADLGAPDLMLIGNGWSIPVHRCPSLVLHSHFSLVRKLQGEADYSVQIIVTCLLTAEQQQLSSMQATAG